MMFLPIFLFLRYDGRLLKWEAHYFNVIVRKSKLNTNYEHALPVSASKGTWHSEQSVS